MKRDPTRLTEIEFDLAIVGGGILGAGIARDARLRGLSVALVEKDDFASGTSSRSTKLVHGGLRYLEQLAFGLVAESCRERSILLEMAPHLVTPCSFLLPAYEGDPRSLWKLRLGTTIYDLLTTRRHSSIPRHRTLTAEEAVSAEPYLQQDGLRGAVSFYDCQMDDARLCLETILDAKRNGAVCNNYCEVTGLRRCFDRIEALQVTDRISGNSFDVRAKCFVNATGPWIEKLGKIANRGSAPIQLSPTKGVHLVVPPLNREHGIYFQSKRDGRMIFLLPWGEHSLLGTTDTSYVQSPDQVHSNSEDVTYLIQQLQSVAPDCNIHADDVIATFAGIRALIRSSHGKPSKRSREERVSLTNENMLHIAGGKYTTFRAIAEKVVRLVYKVLDLPIPKCSTATTPLVDRRPSRTGMPISKSPAIFESDIKFACTDEMAVTVDDVMRRRTTLALSQLGGSEVAEHVSRIMSKQLDWSEDTRRSSLTNYLRQRELESSWRAVSKLGANATPTTT